MLLERRSTVRGSGGRNEGAVEALKAHSAGRDRTAARRRKVSGSRVRPGGDGRCEADGVTASVPSWCAEQTRTRSCGGQRAALRSMTSGRSAVAAGVPRAGTRGKAGRRRGSARAATAGAKRGVMPGRRWRTRASCMGLDDACNGVRDTRAHDRPDRRAGREGLVWRTCHPGAARRGLCLLLRARCGRGSGAAMCARRERRHGARTAPPATGKRGARREMRAARALSQRAARAAAGRASGNSLWLSLFAARCSLARLGQRAPRARPQAVVLAACRLLLAHMAAPAPARAAACLSSALSQSLRAAGAPTPLHSYRAPPDVPLAPALPVSPGT
jgi:hypothetical protein